MKPSIPLKFIEFLVLLVGSALFVSGCQLVDPTEVSNPQITDQALQGDATGASASLIAGCRRQYSISLNNVHILDVASDNYFNTASFISNDLDKPGTVSPLDLTLPTVYNAFQALHALADFGLTTVLPADAAATPSQKAEVSFYKAMALILLAENFSAFPIKELGPLVTSQQAAQIAVDQLKSAFGLTSDANMRINCKLALARAYRLLGDKVNAAAEASNALALPGGGNYVFYAQYDAANLTNVPFSRIASLPDLQPLPRLDFLDPKYTTNSTSIPGLKSEEAYLILAEVALSNNDLAGAKSQMANAVTLARSRPTSTYNDKDARSNRPNNPLWTVKAGPNASAIAGLIQKRGGTSGSPVTLYSISGTSVTAAQVNQIASRNEATKTLYLLRQEIFFLEGRRMSDLGIRLPVTDRQIQTNPNESSGGPGTRVTVPSYIPLGGAELDAYTVDATSGVVTIKWDMNQLIADNIAQVSPFTF